jgi:hypothetical protein
MRSTFLRRADIVKVANTQGVQVVPHKLRDDSAAPTLEASDVRESALGGNDLLNCCPETGGQCLQLACSISSRVAKTSPPQCRAFCGVHAGALALRGWWTTLAPHASSSMTLKGSFEHFSKVDI